MGRRQTWFFNALAILSGVLIATSHIAYYPWALFFGLVPLWLTWLSDPRPFVVFFRGWLAQFTMLLIGFYWIITAATQYGHLPFWIGFLILILYSSFYGLYFPLAGLTWALLNKKISFNRTQSLFLFASLTFIYETFFPAIFPWNLGYPWFSANLPVYQWADYIGTIGLSLLVYLINFVSCEIYLRYRQNKKWIMLTTVSFCLFIFLQISGYWHGLQFKGDNNLSSIKILVVQANIGNNEKTLSEKSVAWKKSVVETYLQLTRKGLATYPDTDLIVWPETAYPAILNNNDEIDMTKKMLLSFIQNTKKSFLIGGYFQDKITNQKYNAAFLFDEKGKVIGHYQKNILLAFGEYFPGASYLPFLKKIVPEISDLQAGKGPTLLFWHNYKIGMQICYEGLYPDFSRALSLQGANIFINLTNDSWFGGGVEAVQHLYATLARSIEFRTPLIRATNTGISTAAQINNINLPRGKFGKVWFKQYTILINKNATPTFYARIGHPFPYFFTLLLVIYIVLLARKHKRF